MAVSEAATTSAALEAIEELRPAAKQYVQQGMTNLSNIGREKRLELAEITITALGEGGFTIPQNEVKKVTGLDDEQSGRIATALSVIVGLIGTKCDNADDLIEMGRGRIYRDADQEAASDVINYICENRSLLLRQISRGRLASEVLPSLLSFETTLDARLLIGDGVIAEAIPILIVRVDTDAEAEQIWFQMTSRDIDTVINELTKRREEMLVVRKNFPGVT